MDDAQMKKLLAAMNDRMNNFEGYVKGRFEDGEKRMSDLTTKEDFAILHRLLIDPDTGESKLADKEDVARLNNIVHNFTLGVTILSTGGKWIYYSIIALAALFGAWGIFTGGVKAIGVAVIHSMFTNSQ